jgi:hypothetical protein
MGEHVLRIRRLRDKATDDRLPCLVALDSIDSQQEMNSIDSTQKQKLQSYNLAKGGLTNIQRKKT